MGTITILYTRAIPWRYCYFRDPRPTLPGSRRSDCITIFINNFSIPRLSIVFSIYEEIYLWATGWWCQKIEERCFWKGNTKSRKIPNQQILLSVIHSYQNHFFLCWFHQRDSYCILYTHEISLLPYIHHWWLFNQYIQLW